MAQIRDLIETAYDGSHCFADMVFGELEDKIDDGKPFPKFSKLSPEDQAEINSDFRLKIIAQAAHDRDPVPLIAAEKKILDFKDRKIAFLDRVYTLKRTYIFSHGKTSKNITPTTFDEIMAEYDYFKTSTAEFETEEDRHFYLATVDRWLSQIVRIGQVWQDLEKDHAQIKKIAQESTLATLQPQVHEEVVDRPWKQFLDGDASGWPMDWAQGKDVVEKMRVPNGGVRIIEDWEKETKSVYRDLDEARGGPSRFRSGLGSALQTKVLLNDGKHVRTLNIGRAQASLFTKFPEGLPRFEGDLFPANTVISRLDGHVAAPRWKAATLQVKEVARSESGKQQP